MKTLRFFLVAIILVCLGSFFVLRRQETANAETAVLEAKQQMAAATETTVVEETFVVEDAEDEYVAIEEIEVTEESVVGNVGGHYAEGEMFGLVSYNNIECALAVGMTEDTLDGQAMLHSLSTPNHLVILGHCYNSGAVFGRLYSNSEVGTEVVVEDFNGTSVTYIVESKEWVDEETYNSEEFTTSLILEDESALVLVTCRKEDGIRGRLIVKCGIAQ